MKLFNTLTREKEEFIIRDGEVKMYVCGPTVYNYFHIGNARCFVVFDMLRRYLEYRGNKVTFVQNFTDVDDKLIKAAKENGCTVPDIADKYIKEYFTDAHGLGVKDATIHPRATENIDKIIEIIETLINKGNAYVSGTDVYFDSQSNPNYGKLSHYNMEDLEAGARIDVNDIKKHPFDFALWKGKKEEGEISWVSPWGEGRPGWHIECSAMVDKFLGTDIDIHGGGVDLIFPHHENEIAQSECATGCSLARFWLHNGHINVDNKKMSKSAGNFFLVRDAAGKYGYPSVRFFLLSSHYRSPINYSDEILSQASAAVERLQNCLGNIEFAAKNACGEISEAEKESIKYLESKKISFIEAMDDDLNTADAIGYLFEMTRDINTVISNVVSKEYIDSVCSIYVTLCELLGFTKDEQDEDVSYIEEMINKRAQAKKERNFAEADAIRNELLEKGIVLEDTRQGVKWKRV
jgi:cysteinyl-tRNA synthetase